MAGKGIIYLTGVGRSGTTVLQSMLHAHSKINFPVETHFFKRFVLSFFLNGKKVKNEDLRRDKYLQRLPAEKQKVLFSKDFENLDDLRGGMVTVMSSPEEEQVSYLGDKDTEYVRYLPHLKVFFSEAYFIHIIRDPRDVVASRLKTEWGAKRSFLFHVAEYQYYIKEVRKLGPELFGERYIELRYEDLIVDPRAQLSELMSKLSLDFEEQMLTYHNQNSGLVADDEKAWKQNVSKPLDGANFGKWRKSFEKSQVAVIQYGLQGFMTEMKYEMEDLGKPGFVTLAKLNFFKSLFIGKTWKERMRKLPKA